MVSGMDPAVAPKVGSSVGRCSWRCSATPTRTPRRSRRSWRRRCGAARSSSGRSVDMVGGGPDPERVVELTRARCAVALLGNHDYGATGSVELSRLGEDGSAGQRSIELARERLSEDQIAWLRSRRPAARREGVQCWHGGPRNPVWEFVGRNNAAACLEAQRAPLGPGRPHPPRGRLRSPAGAPRTARRDRARRAARRVRRQVDPESRRGRCPGSTAARLVGRARRRGRRRRVLAAARPGGGASRPGGARRTTRRRPASAPARWGSTTPWSRTASERSARPRPRGSDPFPQRNEVRGGGRRNKGAPGRVHGDTMRPRLAQPQPVAALGYIKGPAPVARRVGGV